MCVYCAIPEPYTLNPKPAAPHAHLPCSRALSGVTPSISAGITPAPSPHGTDLDAQKPFPRGQDREKRKVEAAKLAAEAAQRAAAAPPPGAAMGIPTNVPTTTGPMTSQAPVQGVAPGMAGRGMAPAPGAVPGAAAHPGALGMAGRGVGVAPVSGAMVGRGMAPAAAPGMVAAMPGRGAPMQVSRRRLLLLGHAPLFSTPSANPAAHTSLTQPCPLTPKCELMSER